MNPIKVPNWEINNKGLLPNLSLSFPNIGPKTKPNIALMEKTNPIITVDVWYSSWKNPDIGRIKENPIISIKTEIQSGVKARYLNNFFSLIPDTKIFHFSLV